VDSAGIGFAALVDAVVDGEDHRFWTMTASIGAPRLAALQDNP
jgi:hypothetical protein